MNTVFPDCIQLADIVILDPRLRGDDENRAFLHRFPPTTSPSKRNVVVQIAVKRAATAARRATAKAATAAGANIAGMFAGVEFVEAHGPPFPVATGASARAVAPA